MTLVLERVTRRLGPETHIYETSLALAPGSLTVLLGPTLAGKTTLLRLMAGLDRPSTGRILVDGREVTGESVRRRDVAMVYQQFVNYPAFSVYDNIAAPLRRRRTPRAEVDRRVREVAATLGLGGLLDRLPAELSGGQQQRTALARALVKDAGLLLLDEPLVNLDYKLREALREELRTLFAAHRSIVVYATTEPAEALMMGGDVMVIDAGRILQTGPSVTVYNRPDTVRVGAVFSDPPMNAVEGTVAEGTATFGRGVRFPLAPHMRSLAPGPYRFGVRAHHLFLDRRGAADIDIPAIVALAEISGSETFIHASHDGTAWVAQEEGVHSVALGAPISLYVDPRHMFVFDPGGRLAAAPG